MGGTRAEIRFEDIRSDWYYGVDYVVRLLRRATSATGGATFVGFPRQWVPLLAWLGVPCRDTIAPPHYIPFISNRSEAELLEEVARARTAGQLRLLVEVVAASDVILTETLQRLDLVVGDAVPVDRDDAPIRLTTWHAYCRPEIRQFDNALGRWRPTRPKVLFLPCGRKRPYESSPTHRRYSQLLRSWGVDMADYDHIVITSLGPVPSDLWDHPAVLRYDTGVRDIYRMLVLLRRLLAPVGYEVGMDCLGFRPYRDLLSIVARERLIRDLIRPGPIRGRKVGVYDSSKLT